MYERLQKKRTDAGKNRVCVRHKEWTDVGHKLCLNVSHKEGTDVGQHVCAYVSHKKGTHERGTNIV